MSMYLPDNVTLCNCAECGCDLIGGKSLAWYRERSEAEKMTIPTPVLGRINGRPYCCSCLSKKNPYARPGRKEDMAPSQENAIRNLEGD